MKEAKGLSVLDLVQTLTWFETELDAVTDLKVGQSVEFMTEKVERTA